MNSRHLTSVCVLLATVQVATAANIPVVPKKLVVVDKLVAASKAKVAFVVKDPAVTKGAGVDAEQISVQVDLAYGGGSVAGAFVVPAGTASGWVVNKATVAKYVNKSAPAGATEAKVAVVKPAKLLKLVGKGLGDTPFDILAGGPPAGSVFTAYCVDNAGEENCHCSEFTGCVHKAIGGGTGAKLVCKTGVGDGVCTASVPATTTTTSTSTTTTTVVSGCYVDTGLTVVDTCNNLEWEKKDTVYGSGVDAGNLHDVDNRYSWAGECTIGGALCQPDAAAAATCTAQTGGALGCAECGVGEGACNVDPLTLGAFTTIWDWVNQVNAANFAGRTDWRLPTAEGYPGSLTGDPAELETLQDPGVPGCGPGVCVDPIFGPVGTSNTWSASTSSLDPADAESVVGWTGGPGPYTNLSKFGSFLVRAVRSSP